MAPTSIPHSSQPLILFSLLFLIIHSSHQTSLSSYILPLRATKIPSSSLPHAPNKLPFHHNVTLTVSLQVGTPPQNVTMVIDTGSELSYMNCNNSTTNSSNFVNNDSNNATYSLRPYFNPANSSSYSNITCPSPTCTSRTRDFQIPVSCDTPSNFCHATLSYADMSSADVVLASDTFRVGSSNIADTVFGCTVSSFSSNPEEDSKTTGLMGMNRGSLSFISQFGLQKFSYCISGSDYTGVLLLGESNDTWLFASPLNYTALVQISTPLPYFNRVAYTVQFKGIKVGEKTLELPETLLQPDHTGAGQTMFDSGTQFTILLGPVYTALKSEFYNQTVNNGLMKDLGEPDFIFAGTMDLCYKVNNQTQTQYLPELPSVTLLFEGAEMRVAGRERLIYRVPGEKRGEDDVYCFTFGNSDLLGVEAYVIGHHHQQNVWMEFDLERKRMGLAPVRCDLAVKKLGLVV